MSIIGEYIHYDFNNYREFGLNKSVSNKRDKPSYYDIISSQKKAILAKADILKGARGQNKVELENRLNFFRPGNNIHLNYNYSKEDKEKIENIICEIILEKLNKYNAKINFFDLSAETETSGIGFGLDRGNLRWELSENGKNLANSISARLTALNTAIGIMKNNNMENASELNQRLENLQNEWKVIEKTFLEQSPEGKMITWSKFSDITGTENFTQRLNNLWKEFKKNVNSYVQGQLGEYYASLALAAFDATQRMGVKEIKNYLKDKLKNKALGMSGFNSVKQGIKIDNFVVQGFTEQGRNLSQDVLASRLMSGKGIKVKAVQGKVDLQITDTLYGIGNYNISIKNYFPEAGALSVQSGENLIFKLTQNYPEFMNHYLNITASGTRGLVNGGLVQYMNEMLKVTLAISGLIGDYTSTGMNLKADTLVYKKGNAFKVVFMDEIIKKIIENPSFALIYEISNNKRWLSSWVGDSSIYSYPNAYSRIVSILAQLNNLSIKSIKISTQALV